MRKIIITTEFHNDKEAGAMMEHIAILIEQGHLKGIGWHLEGEGERERVDDEEDVPPPSDDDRPLI